MRNSNQFVAHYLEQLQVCIDNLPKDRIAAVADRLLEAYRQDRLVVIMGNGGSASSATHMVCDLSKTVFNTNPERRRFRVLSLTDNPALLTAWANDASYDTIFAEQVRTWVSPGDVVIAISGSGNSPNVVEGVRLAQALGAFTIGFLGFDGGLLASLVDLPVLVASDNYGHIEDLHMMFGHLVTAYIRGVLDGEQESEAVSHPEAQGADSGSRGRHPITALDPAPAKTNGAH